eukprot:13179173-Ditylum_brightwellii.AAC.1
MSESNGTNAAGTIDHLASYHKDFKPPENGKQHVEVGWKTVGKRNGSGLPKLSSLSQKARKKVEVKNNANDKDAEVPMECMEPSNLLANEATNAT